MMDNRVEAITKGTLAPLVCKVVGEKTAATPSRGQAVITQWQVESIHGGWGGAVGGTALYRFTGQTEQNVLWSLVLKILYERPGESETSPYYWKREYELYRSGLLNRLPDVGLTPPTIYGFAQFSDSCWIWMADIQDEKKSWALADYRVVSRRLGRFNGAYLCNQPIPDDVWLSDSWHCAIVPPLADTFERLDDFMQHPLAQCALPLTEKEAILSIWQERDRFCNALATLPQTFCHLDAFRRNIFHREQDSILIDWAMAGRAAIGEELVTMVSLSIYFAEHPADFADVLDEAVFSGYIAGLRDVGWQGDTQLARLGYCCAMVLRGLAGVQQDLKLLVDEDQHAQFRKMIDYEDSPTAMMEIADNFAHVRRFRLLKMANEARQLLEEFDENNYNSHIYSNS
ncbi:hypothetical protein MNBD_CHLOROFLEXI01-949 [hydrothermal vent metagenome]|uniref:Aminoglycoside phosphotransferase domain-containing protein n=1 Tax=hydrothermal vent metagenome TaxID=652676 RepID=A0A3B0V1Y1_9ZZZZ